MFVSLELCNDPRNSFGTLVILGVLTFGISLLIWYIHLKRQSNDADKGTYVRSYNVCKVVVTTYVRTYVCIPIRTYILGLKRMVNLRSRYSDANIYGYPTDSDIMRLILLAIYFKFINTSSAKYNIQYMFQSSLK